MSFVYLIESECGRIKVGSSCAPERRLAALYTNSPRPLRLIAFWPGSQSDEMQIHKRFAAYRTHNEWFRPEGDFADFVGSKRGLGVASIPGWKSLEWLSLSERARLKKSVSQRAVRADPVWKAEQAHARLWRRHVKERETALGREFTHSERLAALSAFRRLNPPPPPYVWGSLTPAKQGEAA